MKLLPLLALIFVSSITFSQSKRLAVFNIETWPSPTDTTVYQLYEDIFDEYAQGKDTLVQVYLGQSVWWQADATSPWFEFVFDSVRGRGDTREVLISIYRDSILYSQNWLSYTTRIYNEYWMPLFSRGIWHSVYQDMPDATTIEVIYCLNKVVGLDAQSRALLWFHGTRKPQVRWWKSP